MRLAATLAFGLGTLACPALCHAQHRQLGPHEHGKGTLNVAIDVNLVSMEFEAPGDDIIGFEHEAKTPAQKAAAENGKSQLLAPLALFKFPAGAGCTVSTATVKIEGEDHDHDDHDKDAAAGKGSDSAKEAEAHEEHHHSEFHAQYTFDCKTPAKLTAMDFPYFVTFPRAQRLEVNVIAPKGQTKFEVSRSKPHIDLTGMM